MKKLITTIVTAIAIIIAATDNVLYRTFGYVSCFRQHKWDNKAHNIQAMLNYEHSRRDRYNKINGTDWTTKRVMGEIKD